MRTPEGVHLAFPLRVPGGQLRFDVASGIVRPDSDQLAGSARNFVEAQSWVDVSNDRLGVTVATPDAPLVEVGGILAESPWLRSLPASQTFYSYVMNNYWHTNYKADQEGPVTFRYALRPHGAYRADEAARFGAEAREPLLVAAAAGPAPSPLPLLRVSPAAVLVTALAPGADGRSWTVELLNPTGVDRQVALRWRPGAGLAWRSSDGSGRPGAESAEPLTLPAHATAVVRAAAR